MTLMDHPHVAARAEQGPVKVADQHPTGTAVTRFNTKLALGVTKAVGSMWCAYAFAALSATSLPGTLAMHSIVADVQWIAQTFFQLVLLSVILVGQNVQGSASDKRAEQTFNDVEALMDGHTQLAGALGRVEQAIALLHEVKP